MYARRTLSFSRAECDICNIARMYKSNFTTKKSCSVHMTVFENVVHKLDTIMDMMYLGADNSSIDCRGTLTIHSYSQLHDPFRCNLKQSHDMRPIHLNLPTNVIL